MAVVGASTLGGNGRPAAGYRISRGSRVRGHGRTFANAGCRGRAWRGVSRATQGRNLKPAAGSHPLPGSSVHACRPTGFALPRDREVSGRFDLASGTSRGGSFRSVAGFREPAVGSMGGTGRPFRAPPERPHSTVCASRKTRDNARLRGGRVRHRVGWSSRDRSRRRPGRAGHRATPRVGRQGPHKQESKAST